MGDCGETRKGQNLETIISKLSRENTNGRRNSFMLISGIDHSNIMFHLGTGSGQDSDGEESDPDLFQCGKCKHMFNSLQKYLKHKAAKDCSVQLQGNRTVVSPVTNGESVDSLDDSNSVHSPTKRKHDRKGIARRVSNFSSEGESVSPDIPVVVPGQTYSIPPSSFPVQIEPPSTSNYHNFSNPLVSISVTEVLRSHSPVVVQPTVQQPNFHLWNGTVNEQRPDSPVNPPTMATGAYSPLLESTPVVNPSPAPNLPLHHPGQSSQGITMNSPSMNPQLNTPRLKGMLVDGQPAPAPPPVHMTRSKNALGQPPPLVVHLKDRGRPVRAKETGLTEEELTDEVVTPSGQKVFRCKKCDKEFSFSSRLKRHLLVHTGARPFECHVCSRRFTQAVDLKRHMLRHSGQKPHVCQFCGKQYTRGDRLKVHLLQHTHEDNTEKPYNCSRCGASFFEAEQLRLHVCELQDGSRQVVVQPGDPSDVAGFGDDASERPERTGKSYTCDECHATFTKYTSLKSHLLKHTGEKKYRCEHCHKTFFSSSSLKIHVRVHTGDRPFKCKECPRKFSDPSNFNKHKRWHAKQKASNTSSSAFVAISENGSSPEEKKELASAGQSGTRLAEETAVIQDLVSGMNEEEQTDAGGSNKEDLRADLFPEAGQDMEHEESSGFKSPEALLRMSSVPEANIKQEMETD